MAEERSRKVHVVLYKETGKWGYEFDAYVRPSLHLWHEAELFADIETTQTEVTKGTIYSGFFVVLSGGDDDDGSFLNRLFTPEQMRALRPEALDLAGGCVMAWECDLCDETHREPADCCACGGDGYQEDDGSACACGCPKGQQMADEAAAEFAWMIPHVRRSEAARRRGDVEEAERIRRDALREDAEVEAEANMFGEGDLNA